MQHRCLKNLQKLREDTSNRHCWRLLKVKFPHCLGQWMKLVLNGIFSMTDHLATLAAGLAGPDRGFVFFFLGGGRWLGRGLEVKTFNTRSSKLIYGRFFRNGTSPFSEIGDTSSNVCLSIEMVVFTWRVTSRFTRSSNSNWHLGCKLSHLPGEKIRCKLHDDATRFLVAVLHSTRCEPQLNTSRARVQECQICHVWSKLRSWGDYCPNLCHRNFPEAPCVGLSLRCGKFEGSNLWSCGCASWKIHILNPKMKVWKMIFLLKWVIFSFQPLIFRGV